jgi:multidrug efflux system membrane fusion protein
VRVAQAQTALDDTVLRAPLDGIVLRRAAEVGALAAPGTVGFSVGDTATMKVVFGVPDMVVETLRLGTEQSITTEAMRGTDLTGRISRISPVADAKSRVFEVEISIPNPQQKLKAGMIASLKLGGTEGASLPVAVLPLTAIVRAKSAPGRYAVVVVDEKSGAPTAHVREVEIGEFLGNKIPIKSGLNDGEKVVVMGATLLADGDPVQVIP